MTQAEIARLPSARPPYGLCWLCNRRFMSYRGVRIQHGGHDVWVHRQCVAEVLK